MGVCSSIAQTFFNDEKINIIEKVVVSVSHLCIDYSIHTLVETKMNVLKCRSCSSIYDGGEIIELLSCGLSFEFSHITELQEKTETIMHLKHKIACLITI